MQRPLLVSIILLFLLPSGCTVGPSIHSARQAHNPTGVNSEIRYGEHIRGGELIAVREEGIVILSRGNLSVVPFKVIQSARFSGRGAPRLSHGRRPDEDGLERLRQLSRYPHGLSNEVLQRLLDEFDQDELTVVQ